MSAAMIEILSASVAIVLAAIVGAIVAIRKNAADRRDRGLTCRTV